MECCGIEAVNKQLQFKLTLNFVRNLYHKCRFHCNLLLRKVNGSLGLWAPVRECWSKAETHKLSCSLFSPLFFLTLSQFSTGPFASLLIDLLVYTMLWLQTHYDIGVGFEIVHRISTSHLYCSITFTIIINILFLGHTCSGCLLYTLKRLIITILSKGLHLMITFNSFFLLDRVQNSGFVD